MAETPHFTVIVPCYRSAHTVAETLSSVADQSYGSWDCLIIDDGSPDELVKATTPWCEKDPRFQLIRQSNRGLSGARNRGIKEARGQWLIFLDSDDLLAPGKMEAHAEQLHSANYLHLPYGGCRYFRDAPSNRTFSLGRDGGSEVWMPKVSGNRTAIMPALARDNIVPVSAPVVSRKLAEQLAGFDETLQSLEDWDFWIRCTLAGAHWSFNLDDACETWIRIGTDSMSNDGARMFSNELVVRRKHRDVPEMKIALTQKRHFQIKALLRNLMEGNWRLASRRSAYFRPLGRR